MTDKSPAKQIDEIIRIHSGWKGDLLKHLREIVTKTDPNITEEVKWKMATRPEGLPVWEHNGIVCFAEIWKDNVKLLIPKGADLSDPKGLFNARLQSRDVRAIEFKEGDSVDEQALQNLVREALNLNDSK